MSIDFVVKNFMYFYEINYTFPLFIVSVFINKNTGQVYFISIKYNRIVGILPAFCQNGCKITPGGFNSYFQIVAGSR